MSSSLVGQQLGKYRIVELIGQGGMATVYKGVQPGVDRNVAIKVLPPHPGRESSFSERFRLEALTIARLQHPHILPLYDYGDENGILYLVMAYIPGGSLSDRIRRGALPLPEIDRLLRQIASALDYAHRHGVIHRDIKPDNVLIDSEGFPLLADFGIAKLVEEDARLTMTGSMVGTPAYMSPEQGQGLPVGPQSDIYSLGAVVYEMMTGRQPYTADTPMQVVMKHMTAPVPAARELVSTLPASLDSVMQHVLAKTPEERYTTATAFAEDFSRALRGQQPIFGGQGATVPAGVDEPPTVSFQQSPAPTPAPAPTAAPVNTPQPTGERQRANTTTIVVPTGVSTVLLVVGIGVIALLVALVLALATRQNEAPAVANLPVITDEPPTPVTEVAIAVTDVPRFGTVSFSSDAALGDTVTVQVDNLAPPPADHDYVVWLINTQNDDVLSLGALRLDPLGDGVLTVTTEDATLLPSQYNGVIITPEETLGAVPTGDVVYSGSLPTEVTTALTNILVASDAGLNGDSLLETALTEAEIGQQHAGLAANSTTAGALHTHAEHTVNILLGTRDDLNGDGSPQNPGRGVGVTPMLEAIETHLDDAANAPGASRTLQSQIELIRTCVQNTRERVDEVVSLERTLLEAEAPEDVVDEATLSTTVAEQIIAGFDLNENGQIEPFEGECGLDQIASFGVLVGNLEINAGPLPE